MRHIKLFLSCLLAFIFVLNFSGCAFGAESEEPSVPEETDPTAFFNDAVSDEEVKENIFNALDEINIDTEAVENFEKTEEGKFSFDYKNEKITVLMDSDSTVYSVKIGENGEDVYLKGYESYNIEDYVFPPYMNKNVFLDFAKNIAELAYDSSANYEFSEDFEIRREGDYYYLTAAVTFEGSEDKDIIEATLYYDLAENTIFMEYVTINGEVFSDFENNYEKPEREKIS